MTQHGVELGFAGAALWETVAGLALVGEIRAHVLGAAVDLEARLMQQAAGIRGAARIERKSAERPGLVIKNGERIEIPIEVLHA